MSEWLHINKIEMLVVKAEYNYELEKTLQGISQAVREGFP